MKAPIAEDDRLTCKLMQIMLEEKFNTVDVSGVGFEAIILAWEQLKSETPYGVICLDIMMPNRDGRAVLKSVRDMEDAPGTKLGKRGKIVITTGLEDSENVLSSFRGQCDASLLKPVTPVLLTEKLAGLGFDS